MSKHDDRSRKLIERYLDEPVEAKCDGVVYDDEPNTFTLRFADPDELREAIGELYPDELDLEPWNELVPVAAVSVPERDDSEFAWVFLDWRQGGKTPSVRVATHDNWSGELAAPDLAALGVR